MPIKEIQQEFQVTFRYPVIFTEGLFDPSNPVFARQINAEGQRERPKILVVLDEGLLHHYPDLYRDILTYAAAVRPALHLLDEPVILPGGEEAKNCSGMTDRILDAIEGGELDRHSFLTVVGGGAVIDVAGYAAAIAHRGIRLIRVPTTGLSQNDAAVGVKNGVNAYGKKNFIGTFTPPHAVLNDFRFLESLDDRDWRSGISEAIKVALIKDASFFNYLERESGALRRREMESMKSLIYRCAELHLEHIATSGDPFESGSSRPLDFGHWAAHKLEQMTGYDLRHGEAVAIGIALDTTYSMLKGMLDEKSWHRVLDLFMACGFRLYLPELEQDLPSSESKRSLLHGLEEFREHLGGELTIMLLEGIGKGVEVHEVDVALFKRAAALLRSYENEPA